MTNSDKNLMRRVAGFAVVFFATALLAAEDMPSAPRFTNSCGMNFVRVRAGHFDMSVHQTPDKIIHLISSKQYYAFNLAWLMQDPPVPLVPASDTE